MPTRRTRICGVACLVAGAVLAGAGVTCFWISSHAVEKTNGVLGVLGSSATKLHDVGLLGDFTTYRSLWELLGLSCLVAAPSLPLTWRLRNASVGLFFLVSTFLSLMFGAPLAAFLLWL